MQEEWRPWVDPRIDCNPLTGVVMWRYRPRGYFSSDQEHVRWNTRYALTPAFNSENSKGYLVGGIDGKRYLAHRVVWACAHGRWPEGEVDHINGDTRDNRICNLREVDRTGNCRNAALRSNNTSGCVGVSRSGARWLARIGTGKDRKTLGTFSTFDAAVSARKAAEKQLGYTERHGTRKLVENLPEREATDA